MNYLLTKTDFVGHWNKRRFSFDNMLPHFFSVFTNGCVDTVPVVVRKPVNSAHISSIYTGKSKTCCVKFQVVCDNMGHIINVHGPFSSLDYDSHIWEECLPQLNLWVGIDDANPEHSNRFEVYLGDGHYSISQHCAVPIKRTSNRPLEPIETEYNNFFGSIRATVEQAFGYLKTWAILGSVYRGFLLHEFGYTFLCTAFRLCCELYNARFTILGHHKRVIRVYGRDEAGAPLCPPPNLTPENLRLRQNLHNHLTRANVLSHANFYTRSDIDSGNTVISFRTGEPVWYFNDENQHFVKGNITGCVNGCFSFRSSNKNIVITGVHPRVLFPRLANSQDVPPVISHFAIPASISLSSTGSLVVGNVVIPGTSGSPIVGTGSRDPEISNVNDSSMLNIPSITDTNHSPQPGKYCNFYFVSLCPRNSFGNERSRLQIS
jgi:hypothetical protein